MADTNKAQELVDHVDSELRHLSREEYISTLDDIISDLQTKRDASQEELDNEESAEDDEKEENE
jgi:hypothetical protein